MGYINSDLKIRDLQDSIELHVYGKVRYDKGFMFVDVEGIVTQDKKVPVINTGYSFNLPENTNAEVLLLANGSSVNDKIAIMLIPRDKQHQWKTRTGGIQSPENSEQVVEFNPIRTHIRSDNIALGNHGEIEIKDGLVIIRGNLSIEGSLEVGGNLGVGDTLIVNNTIHAGTIEAMHMKSPLFSGYCTDKPTIVTDVKINRPLHPFHDYEGD